MQKKWIFGLAILALFTTLAGGIWQFRNKGVQSENSKKNHQSDSAMLQLGHRLFFDRRLSINNSRACATCHNPNLGFTDGYKRSIGAWGDLTQRNASPTFNLAAYTYLTAADSGIKHAIVQMNNPLFNEHPIEMGVKGNETKILARLQKDKAYQNLFHAAFGLTFEQINFTHIKRAISAYEYSIYSYNSKYDAYKNGEEAALNSIEKKGMDLFFSSQLGCANCHGGKNFSTPEVVASSGKPMYYFNVGLYNLYNSNAYPKSDQGLFEKTHAQMDMGCFRVPTLRNLAFTAPYFHDGSAQNLEDAVDVFLNGGRLIVGGPLAGDGRLNQFKSSLLQPKSLKIEERSALIAFLMSLTDSSLIKNPYYQNPFTFDETRD
ncbi:MAG: hypothetical protein RLY16_90 [Bacteroidota bacterium]|jgi:cytochrome c peroxidase